MLSNRRFSAWTLAIVTAAGASALGRVSRADVINAPTVVTTAFQHAYSVDGKTTLSTHIEDSVQSATAPTWTPVWHDPPTWVSTLAAPAEYRFVITPAPGFGHPTTMSIGMTWNVSTPVTDYTVYFSTTSYYYSVN